MEWSRAQSYGVFDVCDIYLDGLNVLCRVLDPVEDLTDRRLLKHLANERNGGGKVGLDYFHGI